MTHVEIHTGVARLMHLQFDGMRDNIPGSQFHSLIIVSHEAFSLTVNQMRTLAPDCLGDQATVAPGDIKHRWVKLHEFHVAQLSTGTKRDSNTITCGHFWVTRLSIKLTGSPGTENGLLGPDQGVTQVGSRNNSAPTTILVGEQIQSKRVFPNPHMRQLVGPARHHPHYFRTCCITIGMDDAMMAMPPFFTECQFACFLIKRSAPTNQFLDSVGSFADHHLHNLPITEITASDEGILHMAFEAVARFDGPRNATLSIHTTRLF